MYNYNNAKTRSQRDKGKYLVDVSYHVTSISFTSTFHTRKYEINLIINCQSSL